MSCPSWIKTYDKDMNLTSENWHNWGFVAPSDFEAGMKIVYIATGLNPLPNFDKNFAYIEDRVFGVLTRENYSEMYYDLKGIHHGLRRKKEFIFKDYFE